MSFPPSSVPARPAYLEFRCGSDDHPGKLSVLEQGRTVFIGPLTPTGIKSAAEAIELELMTMLPAGAS